MIKKRGYMLKSKGDDYSTPKDIIWKLEKEFGKMHDPCPLNYMIDGLRSEWKEVNFINPPYSDWASWVKKGVLESSKGKTCIFLLFSRTDTKAFHEYLYNKPNVEIRFLKGRLKFGFQGNKPVGCATNGSMLCIMRGNKNDKPFGEEY